jgi:hypothetical protein
VALLADGHPDLLVARVCLCGDQETVQLVLHDQLAVVAIGFAFEFCCGFRGLLLVQVRDRLDLKQTGRRHSLEHAPTGLVQPENGRG